MLFFSFFIKKYIKKKKKKKKIIIKNITYHSVKHQPILPPPIPSVCNTAKLFNYFKLNWLNKLFYVNYFYSSYCIQNTINTKKKTFFFFLIKNFYQKNWKDWANFNTINLTFFFFWKNPQLKKLTKFNKCNNHINNVSNSKKKKTIDLNNRITIVIGNWYSVKIIKEGKKKLIDLFVLFKKKLFVYPFISFENRTTVP